MVGKEGEPKAAKLGDARVVRNERTGKWEARLCFQFHRPPAVGGTEVLAVHRGMRNFLTLVKTTGEVWTLPGNGYLVQKRAFSARRAQMAAHIRKGELGHGARGHGVRRRYKALNRLDDAEARMIKSACQKAASYTEHPGEKRGQRHGVGVVDCAMREPRASVVLIEDYSKLPPDDARFMPSWPYAQLKGAVAWACQKAGLELREVPAAYLSQRCPACDWTSEDNLSERSVRLGGTETIFECTSCGFKRHTDTVAGFNMLAADGSFPEDVRERFEERMRAFARSMREKKDEAAQ
jgi:transposase